MSDPIYMDHHATTPVDDRVVEAMLPFLNEKFGNFASSHCYGQAVQKACANARAQVAMLVGCEEHEIIFTSGATESNNLAIKGLAEGLEKRGRHIVTSITEHKAVLDTCAYLEGRGWDITYLAVDGSGLLSTEAVSRAIRLGAEGTTERTVLVSIMGANNEIGTIQPFADIGKTIKDVDPAVFYHVDGAQTAGKIPLDVKAANIDLLSVSAHKMYGPKGIGALFLNNRARNEIVPQLHGGGQEGGLRAGTLPVHLVVGLGKAAELAQIELLENNLKLAKLRDRLEQGLLEIGGVAVNGHKSMRLPGNLNVTFYGIDPEFISLALRGVAVSSTSACASSLPEPSYVLQAIGRSPEEAMASIRFGLGVDNTEEDVELVLDKIRTTCRKFQDLNTVQDNFFAG